MTDLFKRKHIIVKKVEITRNSISVEFKPTGKLKRLFNPTHRFTAEYSSLVGDVSPAVAVIPFVCNVLPIVWVTDATLELPELDRAFFDCIPEVKRGYEEMFPSMKFGGKIKVGRVVDATPAATGPACEAGAFFSGGADAFTTLITHHNEHPMLISLWGADIKLNDVDGWENVRKHTEESARQFGVDAVFVKTNFRTFIDEGRLDRLVADSGDGWWHGFQHGMGIIGHGAPIAATHSLQKLYIASSHTAETRRGITCASDPTIDNRLRMASCRVVHDGFELSRQQKIARIANFANRNGLIPNLHVCWISGGGNNCCKCEKCLRTIFAFFAEGVDPRPFGFDYTSTDLENSEAIVQARRTRTNSPLWRDIQNRFRSNPAAIIDDSTRWILDADFTHCNN